MNLLQQKIESLLFFKNEPVKLSWIASQIDVTVSDVRTLLAGMVNFYEGRGIDLILTDSAASLVTASTSQELISGLVKRDEGKELSKQAMETLSVVLYSGRITKAEIDYVRGVNSVFILRNLLIRGLVQKENNPQDKRSPFYTVTHDLLSSLGVTSIDAIPFYAEHKNKISLLVNEHTEELAKEHHLAESSE